MCINDFVRFMIHGNRDFPRAIFGPKIGPFPIKKQAKTPKMVCIIPNCLDLHFGKKFMKIRTKIAKLQMHENLHKNVTFLYKFS